MAANGLPWTGLGDLDSDLDKHSWAALHRLVRSTYLGMYLCTYVFGCFRGEVPRWRRRSVHGLQPHPRPHTQGVVLAGGSPRGSRVSQPPCRLRHEVQCKSWWPDRFACKSLSSVERGDSTGETAIRGRSVPVATIECSHDRSITEVMSAPGS